MTGRRVFALLAAAVFTVSACGGGSADDAAGSAAFPTLRGTDFDAGELSGEPAVVYFWAPG